MADLPALFEIPYTTDLKCPVCENDLEVKAIASISPGTARRVGSAGFRKPIINADVKVEVVKIEINHVCNYTKPEPD